MSTTVRAPRRRSAVLPTLVIIALLIVAFAVFTNLWTERLWFDSLRFGEVFSTMLLTRIGLFVAFGLVMATAVAANTAIAHRLRPRKRLAAPSSQLLERYREVLEQRFVVVMVAIAVVVGLFAGGAATGQVSTYLAWQNQVPFGTTDAKFGLDLSFFIFAYPWWRFVLSFVFVTLVFSSIAAAIVHYVMGALKVSRPGRGGTPAAQAHLSILVGLAIVAKGVGYWFDRYGLAITDSRQIFTGITYTGDNATLQAKTILAFIAGFVALLFFANAVLRRWMVPLIGLSLMVLAAIVLGVVYPGAVQQFSVKPDEPDKERPYIAQSIAATRAAYGVDGVEIQNYDAKTTATAGQLQEDATALPGVRLIDPAKVAPAFEQLQQVRGFYQFPTTLDVDRYTIDGTSTDVVVAAREMDLNNLQEKNWNNLHTVYTHGFGLVAAYGNQRQVGGEPQWVAKDIPPTGEIAEHEPRIYYGELQNGFSIVGAPAGAAPVEFDTPGGGEGGNPKLNTYTGEGGVGIGSTWRRLLYAAKFTDVNVLLSDRVNDASKIIYDRTPRERVQKVAPWLTVDTDAYPAVVEGRMVWIVDGYTTSNSYPNSNRLDLNDATSDAQTGVGPVGVQASRDINYIRNSVKAVVDAYDGSVKLYEWDQADPILKTWEKAFPGAVAPRDQIPADLLSHLRYPEDLFKVQREVLTRYHVTDPGSWYASSDLWQVPPDPTGSGKKESPYFLSIKWPGDDDANFSLTGVFVPNGRQNLAAYMAVNADAASPNYGQMRILRMSDTTQIDGPNQTANAMVSNPTVAETLRPFQQGTSQATYGNLLTLPVGGGLLYVQPVYTQRQGSTGTYPALRFVMVRFGQEVGIGSTLQAALDQVFQGDAGVNTGENGSTGGGTGNTGGGTGTNPDNPAATSQINQAVQAFAAADTALKKGDLATYQAKIKEAQDHVAAASKALGR